MSMLYRIVLVQKAEKQLGSFSKKDQQRILSAFDVLRENPKAGKMLEGEYKGYRSLRVWSYRIVYVINYGTITITVVKVGHRKDVYR